MEVQVTLMISALYLLLITSPISCNLQPPSLTPGLLSPSSDIGDCHACKIFVESFQKGLERTSRGKFEGGDAAWEEEKLKVSYKRSEIRLIDIQEGLCKEQKKYSVQCHHMAEKAEDFIEDWWAQDPDEPEDLYTNICIENLKVCCPKGFYGKECDPCPQDINNVCSGHGKCRGEGTRKGNGTCACDPGYTGVLCDKCNAGYFESTKGNQVICTKCHPSCLEDCRDASPKGCVACNQGFVFDQDNGCTDINECNDINKCEKNEYCLNSLGSYACMPCDKSCASCHGDGPDLCRKCAAGYSKKGELCIKEREDEDQSDQLTTTRYMTYFGLLVATGILLPKSTTLGGCVAFLVLSYILGAEYYCMINGHKGLVDLREYDLTQVFRL